MKRLKQLLAYFGLQQHGSTHRKRKDVSRTEMRRVFNDGDYWGKAQRQELKVVQTVDNHMKGKRPDNCDWCTKTQELEYRDLVSDELIVVVHQYMRPEGTLGASGLPDPHLIFENGIEYHEPRQPPTGRRMPKKNPVAKWFRTRWRRFRHLIRKRSSSSGP